MKRFLTSFVIFALLTVTSYCVVVICFVKFLPAKWSTNINYKFAGSGYLYTRLKEADTTKNVDILILGSSHAYRSYDPDIFKKHGLRVMNLGSSAQTPVQTEVFMKRYIKQMNPKLVLFDVYPKVLAIDGVESALDVVANSSVDAGLLKMIFRISNIRVYNTFIYACYQKLRAKSSFEEKLTNKDDTYIGGGYVRNFSVMQPDDKYPPVSYTPTALQKNAFGRIIEYLQVNNYKYFMVQAPLSKTNYAAITSNAQTDSAFATYGKYYNTNKLLNLADSCFKDDSHLNQRGVNIYDEKIIAILKENNRNLVK